MTWNTIKDNFMVQRAMIDTAQKWINQKKESMPRGQVVEVLLWWNRIALKYIRDERDRQSYGKEVLRLLPKDEDEF